MPGHLLGVLTARWERNPQIPEPPRTPHAPHLRSAGVVVVGLLAASPAASAPIGHAAPPAAGARGRPRQSKARRGLGSFPTRKWTEVTMQVTKLLDAQSCDLRRVGPVDCARAVWRETLSWVPFGAAPPQVTRPTPPDNPLQTAPSLIARYDDARAKPTHARALRRRRRSLARSIARARCGGGDGGGRRSRRS